MTVVGRLGQDDLCEIDAQVARVAAEFCADCCAPGGNIGMVIGHSRHGRLLELLRGSIVQNLLRQAGDVDVHVVADRDKDST